LFTEELVVNDPQAAGLRPMDIKPSGFLKKDEDLGISSSKKYRNTYMYII
jgi:hypothetical protein